MSFKLNENPNKFKFLNPYCTDLPRNTLLNVLIVYDIFKAKPMTVLLLPLLLTRTQTGSKLEYEY